MANDNNESEDNSSDRDFSSVDEDNQRQMITDEEESRNEPDSDYE